MNTKYDIGDKVLIECTIKEIRVNKDCRIEYYILCPEPGANWEYAIQEENIYCRSSRIKAKETSFKDYLNEQMKDPEFKKEYKKIVDKEPKERIYVTSRFKTDLKDALYRKGKPFCVVSKSLGLPRDCITKIINGYTKRITKDRYYLICEALNIDPEV